MATLNGSGAPTRKTTGAIGDIYTDTNTGDQYKCIFSYRSNTDEDYDCQWKKISTGKKPNAKPEVKEVKETKEVKQEEKEVKTVEKYSLFKDVYEDGEVKYSDTDRVSCINIDNPNVEWHMGLVTRIVNEMFPITMPYMPENQPFKVYCKELLTDRKNGDFDSVAIYYVIKPDGERVDIDRYFKEGSENEEPWTEISKGEWFEREELHNERIRKETQDEKD